MATIIVIDDEQGIRRTVRRALQAAGHAVVTYANGSGGIAHLAKAAVDLLITDIFMPEVEGLEMIAKARELHPAMPIIAISGLFFEGADYLPIAAKFGATATLRKPFRPAELNALVSSLLAERTSD